MKWLSRREFLKYSAGLSAVSFIPQFSFSQNANSKSEFVVLVTFEGGWDISLGPDAWTEKTRPPESEYFIEYREDQLIPFGKHFVGPGMASFAKYFDNLTIFNGVYLSSTDLGHPLLRYSETGQGQGELAIIPAQYSELTQKIGLGVLSSRSAYVGNYNLPLIDTLGLSYGNLTEASSFSISSLSETDIQQSQNQIRSMQNQINQFNVALTKSRAENSGRASLGHIVGHGFKLGLSFGANLDVDDLRDPNSNQSLDFDTHSNHERRHLESMTSGFENLKKFMDTLNSIEFSNGVSVLDKTTVVIISDFARTPAKNASGGKDHNPQTSSMLIWSKNSKGGGQIVGASRHVGMKKSRIGIPYLSALPLDINTKMPSLRREGVFIMRPDHVMATVYHSLGIIPGDVHSGYKNIPRLDQFL